MTARSVNVGSKCASERCVIPIARQVLEIELTRTQQTRKLFLIASFSAIPAPGPRHLTNHNPRIAPFLFDTNKANKIIILTRALMKTKEKQFSIRYKFALRSIGNPARALRSCIGALGSHSDQMCISRIAGLPQASPYYGFSCLDRDGYATVKL